ncbi:MAG: ABC transporter permease [Hyphomicrobiales bacterium]
MGRFVARRLLEIIPVLFLVSVFIFMLIRLVPGDPAAFLAGSDASPEDVERTREQLGLTGSPVSQYLNWIGDAIRLDFGDSFRYRLPVSEVIRDQLEPTLQLALSAYLFTLLVGIAGGILAARSRAWNVVVNAIAAVSVGFPTFVLGILLVVFFAVHLGWLPAGGAVSFTDDPWGALEHLILPTVALGSVTASVLMRFVRTAMRDVLAEDYVRTARAKGLRERVIVNRHALRNALIPVITVSALQLGRLLGGALVVEQVFARPGLGRLLVGAIQGRDYLLLQALVLLLVLVFVLANLIADILYGLADPRVRHS